MRPGFVAELAATAAADGIGVTPPPPLHDVHAWFAQWLQEASLFAHLASFWPRRGDDNVLFVHFADLSADLDGQMRRIAAFLGVDIDEAVWPGMVERCGFANMRAPSEQIGYYAERLDGGGSTFFHKGASGQWRDVLTEAQSLAYQQRAREFLPADALDWLTR